MDLDLDDDFPQEENITKNITNPTQGRDSEPPARNRSPIEEFAPYGESEDMAALQRAIERSRQANPRAYGDNTRPGAGVTNGVSFSPFADLEARNREQQPEVGRREEKDKPGRQQLAPSPFGDHSGQPYQQRPHTKQVEVGRGNAGNFTVRQTEHGKSQQRNAEQADCRQALT